MEIKGRTIRIYVDESSRFQHLEIGNRTIQALAFHRCNIELLSSEWASGAADRQGVYFLLDADSDDEQVFYIGESENIQNRLLQHLSAKKKQGDDFKDGFEWNDCIIFTSKDENLTKAHIKYLEHDLYELAISADRYKTVNFSVPQCPKLSLPDRALMSEFSCDIQKLMKVLGHKLFEPVKSKHSEKDRSADANNQYEVDKIFVLPVAKSTSDLIARGERVDEGMRILTGSFAKFEVCNSFKNSYKKQRDRLMNNGVLELCEDGGQSYYKFTKDEILSVSAAASIITGNNVSGYKYWKKNGMSIAESEAAFSQAILEKSLSTKAVN